MQEDYTFLNNLVGNWLLAGEMGDIELKQEVTSRWVLGNKFVSLYFKSITPENNPTSDYEALYHIGFNAEESLFVFHLLDTTRVPVDCDFGRGKRQGNQIPFVFDYGETKFFNILTWHPQEDRWTFRQQYKQEGEIRIFANKDMVKAT